MSELTESELDAMLKELEQGTATGATAPVVLETAAGTETTVIESVPTFGAYTKDNDKEGSIQITPTTKGVDSEKAVETTLSSPTELSKEAIAELEAMEKMPSEPVVATEPVAPPVVETITEPAPKSESSPASAPASEPKEDKYATIKKAPELKRFIDPDQLRKDVTINPNDLDTAMIEHSALYVHYATQTIAARRQHDRIKAALEVLENKLYGECREILLASKEKVTEATIRSAMMTNPRWSSTQARLIEAHGIWKMCEVAERAMDQRKDLLLELARDRRKEKEGSLRVLENQNLRESVLGLLTKNAA